MSFQKRLNKELLKGKKILNDVEGKKENIKNILIKKCPVYEKCPNSYTKKNIVSLAIECGVKMKKGEKITPITLLDINDIDQDKYIKLSNGYCYDIDELLKVMTISKDENINPADPSKTTKIWESEDEKKKIINHKGINPNIKKRYNSMLHLKEKEEEKILKEIGKDTKILKKIAEAGFKCLNNNYSSELFNAQEVLEELRTYINNSSRKIFYDNIKVGSLRLGSILDNIHSECIHGIGFKLLIIYVTWYGRIKKVHSDLKLSKFFIRLLPENIDDKPLYVTTGMHFDNDENPSYIRDFLVKGIYIDDPIGKHIGKFISYNKPKTVKDYFLVYDFDTDKKLLNVLEKNKKKIVDHFYDTINNDL